MQRACHSKECTLTSISLKGTELCAAFALIFILSILSVPFSPLQSGPFSPAPSVLARCSELPDCTSGHLA